MTATNAVMFDELVGALVPACRNNATLVAGRVAVFDGPVDTEDSRSDWLSIGWSDDPMDIEAGEFRLERRTDAGASGRDDETTGVRCTLVHWSGDTDFAAARAAVRTNLSAIAEMLRSNYALGLDSVWFVHIGSGRWFQSIRGGGARVEVRFTVEANALT